VAVIDCHDREIVGWEFALRGRAQEAERALEMACLARFGTLRPTGETPILRSDNGLVFLSRRFREACTFYRLSQEYITPYTPEQNGLIERFLGGAENALRSRPLDDEALKDQEIKRLQRKVGELVMDIDILKEAGKTNPSQRQMRDE
jgi:transposase InsO family protein